MAISDSQDNGVIYYAESTASIFLVGTVTKGDILGFSSGWKRALATSGSNVHARCVALGDGVSGELVEAAFGVCLVGGGRFSGGTANSALYVAEGSNSGKYTETIPTDSGDTTTRIGTVLTSTMLLVTPSYNPDTTV